ncbi:6331_t:CDS:2, partial [Cetraspora pellucida]
KDNLNKIRENRINNLNQKQTEATYDKIWQGISRETNINKLPTNEYWFIQIKNNQSLTENQKIRLNEHQIDKLKLLSNQLYNQINAEIPKIDDYMQLLDGIIIDHKIRSLNDENLSGRRNTRKLQQERRDRLDLFLKEKALKENTDKSQFEDGETYDSLIQELDPKYLTPSRSVKNFDEALDSLKDNFNIETNLMKRMINNYVTTFSEGNIETLKDEQFDHEIKQLDDKNRKILLNLRDKILAIYQDEDRD